MAEASPATSPAPAPPRSPRTRLAWIAVGVVIIVVIASLAYYETHRPSSPPAPLESGGFTEGSVVTFVYNGTHTYECVPPASTFYPGAGAATTQAPCEVGNASQNAVVQVPEWILVPAFAGMAVFGLPNTNSSQGYPAFRGELMETDCGSGNSSNQCPDRPELLYSPLFAKAESLRGSSSGVAGYPAGVLPVPADDLLLNTTTTYPNVPWGTILVLVFDPNIWPNRTTATCTTLVPSNLSNPTGNCLTSFGALARALLTSSSAVTLSNAGNTLWVAAGEPSTQVWVLNDPTVADLNNLNGNLYIPFAVQPSNPFISSSPPPSSY
jgi:hypothetical protein